MLARVLRTTAAARGGSALASRVGARASLCTMEQKGVVVDMVCRVWSLNVKDDETAHEMDCTFDDMVDAWSEVEGCAGASRMVCKSEWDYKFILKFEDLESLQSYMKNDHERIMDVHMPKIKALAVDAKVHEQNFVYDDIE